MMVIVLLQCGNSARSSPRFKRSHLESLTLSWTIKIRRVYSIFIIIEQRLILCMSPVAAPTLHREMKQSRSPLIMH
jgi:hypothetical protein